MSVQRRKGDAVAFWLELKCARAKALKMAEKRFADLYFWYQENPPYDNFAD
jgi:hypothetical protein